MLFLILFAQLSAAPPEIKSSYHCVGVVPTGPYEVLIDVEKDGETYLFTWKTNEVKAKGLGIRVGNTLSVIFMDLKGQLGVVHYKITPVSLDGVWSGGGGKVFTEVCTFGPQAKA